MSALCHKCVEKIGYASLIDIVRIFPSAQKWSVCLTSLLGFSRMDAHS
jgi:hypothetical protein